ncbi:MAG: gliding motility-associated C-terminal domain-containing protein, partial [Bacteroidota bacterium]
TIVNQSPFVQNNLQLRDTFQTGLEIESIHYPNFQGRVLSGVGSNVLALEGFDVPIGTDSILVRLRISPDVALGSFSNQAYLYNVNTQVDGPPEMRRSDDPETAKVEDPTHYELGDLAINFEDEFPVLCAGETLLLDVRVEGALSYSWSTGSQSPSIEISQPGIYDVTVTTPCGSVSGGIYVSQDDLRIDLGDAVKEAEIGARINLKPAINSFSDIQSYYWRVPDNQESLDCWTCPEVEVIAQEGAIYSVETINENGCRATDSIRVNIRPFKFYAPTAFSPDGNGENDQFYLYGQKDFTILNFSVYNRWGARIHFMENGQANDPNFSWDGFHQGQLANAGVYLWGAKVQTENGQVKQLSGEINLIR